MARTRKQQSIFRYIHHGFMIGLVFPLTAQAQLRLPNFFTDNMVLQRDADIRLWGWSNPNTQIRATFDGSEARSQSDQAGEWSLVLPEMPAGGPYELTLIGPDTLRLTNILIGDVWICSGQSNMGMKIGGNSRINNYKEEIQNADFPNIRILTVERDMAAEPQDNLRTNGWEPVSPKTIEDFSATAYFFGRDLQKNLGKNVPIGLLQTSWGGTKVEAWTSAKSLKSAGFFVENLEEVAKSSQASDKYIVESYKQSQSAWEAHVDSIVGDMNEKRLPSYLKAHPEWPMMNIPEYWERTAGHENFDGVMWFQRKIDIPMEWLGKDIFVSLGTIDDYDWTFFNDQYLGHTHARTKPIEYIISAEEVYSDKNLLTIRVLDVNRRGGIWGREEVMFMTPQTGGDTLWLAGAWHYLPVMTWAELNSPPPDNPYLHNRPSVLYNAMLAPLTPLPIKGVIWYQGEANASKAHLYRTTFPLLIQDWRQAWGQGDFPFLYVQLPNFGPRETEPAENGWAELRDAQLQTLNVPRTSMAVTIDIGEERDIHPKNKQEVGNRLALLALRDVYHRYILAEGPRYKSHRIKHRRMYVEFENIGLGLKTTDGKRLTGFSLAGEDRIFYWADAELRGNTVIVSSRQVQRPVALRYAWGANPECNLTNTSGLPASPFKTDDWPDSTRE